MDPTDLGILKILLANNGAPPGMPVLHKSFRSIARDLGVDQGTVRSRMKRLQERHVLRGWLLGLSPGLTGHDVGQAWLLVKPEAEKGPLVDRLLSAPEVERVCVYLGPKVSLLFLVRKGADPSEAVKGIADRIGPSWSLHRGGVIPIPTYPLTETDSSIVRALRKDPWKPFPEVAREVGVSSRTVVRRVAKLSQDGAIYMLPVIDLDALHGVIPMELVVEYESIASRPMANSSIASYVGEELVFSDTTGPLGYFALVVPTLSSMERVEAWVRKQQGVAGAHADALQGVVLNRAHYERKWTPVERQLARRA